MNFFCKRCEESMNINHAGFFSVAANASSSLFRDSEAAEGLFPIELYGICLTFQIILIKMMKNSQSAKID